MLSFQYPTKYSYCYLYIVCREISIPIPIYSNEVWIQIGSQSKFKLVAPMFHIPEENWLYLSQQLSFTNRFSPKCVVSCSNLPYFWGFDWLDTVKFLCMPLQFLWVNVYNIIVVSGKYYFLIGTYYFWLLKSFAPLIQVDTTWPSIVVWIRMTLVNSYIWPQD